jgi:hypothetical protein
MLQALTFLNPGLTYFMAVLLSELFIRKNTLFLVKFYAF